LKKKPDVSQSFESVKPAAEDKYEGNMKINSINFDHVAMKEDFVGGT